MRVVVNQIHYQAREENKNFSSSRVVINFSDASKYVSKFNHYVMILWVKVLIISNCYDW